MLRKTSIVVAALATTATLAFTASPASAARYIDSSGEDTTSTYEPTGTRTMSSETEPHLRYGIPIDDDTCEKAARAANSWLEEAYDKYVNGGDWQTAQNNADQIAGEANKNDGCTLTHPE